MKQSEQRIMSEMLSLPKFTELTLTKTITLIHNLFTTLLLCLFLGVLIEIIRYYMRADALSENAICTKDMFFLLVA